MEKKADQVGGRRNFPVPHETFDRLICNRNLSFLVAVYSDYLLVVVSETGSVGTVLHARYLY